MSPTIPTTNICRQIVANDMPTFRAKLCSKNIRISNKLDRPKTTRARHSYPGIPGRLLSGKPRPRYAEQPNTGHPEHAETAGLDNKHKKVCPQTQAGPRISRCHVESVAKYQVSPGETIHQSGRSNNSVVKERSSYPEGFTNYNRVNELRKFRSSERSPALPGYSSNVQQIAEIRNLEACTPSHGCEARARMVERSLQNFFDDPYSPYDTLSDNRCERHRLGSSIRPLEPKGHMATPTTTAPLQPEGNAGHHQRAQRPRASPELRESTDPVRQPNGSLLSSQRGWNKVCCPDKSHPEIVPDIGSVQYSHGNPPHSRKLQLRRRPPIQEEGLTRVASPASADWQGIQQVGDTYDRSVRITSRSGSNELLHVGQKGQKCGIPRCFQQDMGIPTCLDFPTTTPHPKSPSTLEQCCGDFPYRSSSVEECFLEAGSQEQIPSSPIHNQETRERVGRYDDGPSTSKSGRNDDGSLEMWGWNKYLTNWTEEQQSLLASSWRKSTMNTYRPAWNRWIAWTRAEGIDLHKPTGSDLARFLADIYQKENLSLSTILVHKSVVSTFTNPDCREKLGSHTLVKQVLKAIALAKPKLTKPPIWDTEILIQYLSRKNPELSGLFEICKCAATILLLCSGRRVHDLTLLRVSPEHYTETDDYVILKPVFGSKTDSSSHRQSNWKLTMNKDNRALCPVYWIKRVIHLLQERRRVAKSDSLFITLTEPPRPASRSVIGGWVKKLLEEAGIHATPGSVRSAVASKSWMENCLLDDILARANWKSSNTFAKYYCREITSVSNINPVTRLFTPENN